MGLGDFKNIVGNNPILSNKISEDSHVTLGLINTIDLESQTMSISLILKENNPTVNDIPINSPISASGAGIRFIPRSGMVALLHFDSAVSNNYYHIGYYTGNLSAFTNNILGNKSDDRLVMRCLDNGEVILSNGNGSELYLSNKNMTLLKNGDGFFLLLDEDVFEGLFNDLNFTLNDVLIDAGRIKRVVREYGTKPEDIKDANPKIIRTKDVPPLNEFSVSLGTYINTLGIPDVLKDETFNFNLTPTGTIKLADQIFDEIGEKVTSLKTLTDDTDILQFMLKMGTGIKIGIDAVGSLYVVNEYTDSHIKFAVGATSDGGKITDNTEVEAVIANNTISIKGSEIDIKNTEDNSKFNIVNISPNGISIIDTSSNSIKMDSQGTIILDKNSNTINMTASGITISDGNKNIINITASGITINDANKNTISLTAGGISIASSGDVSVESTVLGETIQKAISDLITSLASHVHAGPVGPPKDAATWLSWIAPSGKFAPENILSKNTKNN